MERSEKFILVALFLSRCGVPVSGKNPLPPPQLQTESWKRAYAMFFDALGGGRTLRAFHNSLKATRDQFDSHIGSGRRGWWKDGQPKPLPERDGRILEKWRGSADTELWGAIAKDADLEVATVPLSVLEDLEAETSETQETVAVGPEGKKRAVVSPQVERSPRLRAAALRIHGCRCQVCNFSFEETYGNWGKGFAEVHHLKRLGDAPEAGVWTNPKTDMAVVCSNCHRMIHRKAKKALTLDELRAMVKRYSATE